MDSKCKKVEWISLIIGFLGVMLGLFGVISFNQYLLMSLPLGIRMVCMPIIYWLIALIPIILMIIYKDKLTDLKFSKEKIVKQIIVGLLIGIGMSLVLTLIPHFAGFGEFVDSGKRYQYLWQYVYEFFYCIIAIGAVEEFVFRGFIYSKAKRIGNKEWIAVVVSSVLFGVFHLFGGNVIQMIMTAIIGAIFCILRNKIEGCTTLSLIVAHGVYDALITVFASILL